MTILNIQSAVEIAAEIDDLNDELTLKKNYDFRDCDYDYDVRHGHALQIELLEDFIAQHEAKKEYINNAEIEAERRGCDVIDIIEMWEDKELDASDYDNHSSDDARAEQLFCNEYGVHIIRNPDDSGVQL